MFANKIVLGRGLALGLVLTISLDTLCWFAMEGRYGSGYLSPAQGEVLDYIEESPFNTSRTISSRNHPFEIELA